MADGQPQQAVPRIGFLDRMLETTTCATPKSEFGASALLVVAMMAFVAAVIVAYKANERADRLSNTVKQLRDRLALAESTAAARDTPDQLRPAKLDLAGPAAPSTPGRQRLVDRVYERRQKAGGGSLRKQSGSRSPRHRSGNRSLRKEDGASPHREAVSKKAAEAGLEVLRSCDDHGQAVAAVVVAAAASGPEAPPVGVAGSSASELRESELATKSMFAGAEAEAAAEAAAEATVLAAGPASGLATGLATGLAAAAGSRTDSDQVGNKLLKLGRTSLSPRKRVAFAADISMTCSGSGGGGGLTKPGGEVVAAAAEAAAPRAPPGPQFELVLVSGQSSSPPADRRKTMPQSPAVGGGAGEQQEVEVAAPSGGLERATEPMLPGASERVRLAMARSAELRIRRRRQQLPPPVGEVAQHAGPGPTACRVNADLAVWESARLQWETAAAEVAGGLAAADDPPPPPPPPPQQRVRRWQPPPLEPPPSPNRPRRRSSASGGLPRWPKGLAEAPPPATAAASRPAGASPHSLSDSDSDSDLEWWAKQIRPGGRAAAVAAAFR